MFRGIVAFCNTLLVIVKVTKVTAQDPNWMLMPDGAGDVRLAVLSPMPSPPPPNEVEFVLWTRDNPVGGEKGALGPNCPSIRFSTFSPKRRTKVLVHGFGDTVTNSYMVPLVRDAFLEKGDFNVFAVDWSQLAKAPWYNYAANNTVFAADMTARLLDDLMEHSGASSDDFHLIGFSLGAHVVGLTGRFLSERRSGSRNGKVRRITGLDPAQVLFTSAEPHQRLDANHANFVEVVHTSGGYLGFLRPLGHVDVYPNGGAWPQPGCVLDFVAVCSHRRAYYIYKEAILSDGKGFEAKSCKSWQDLKMGTCEGGGYPLGADAIDESSRGLYMLETNGDEPFAKSEAEVQQSSYWW